ncbi:type III pantothenate kinase [Neptunitalea lumnitzerae]|uniref:Type III pantothenate kinase n=1 Tax=Neptunitalea lumnitzerae TaxID=2965509 RepID=A0ABQ5MGX8_9FLAO|nr:type III pantothenate kinase [Neptunitalea sp. Y10]GLB48675.1 type III pantothenate kinase [Neptunitalea sp. Y10]
MMNLIIDIGNTFSKVAVFQNDMIVSVVSVSFGELQKKILKIFETNSISRSIVSSVAEIPSDVLALLKSETGMVLMSNDLKMPFSNKYKTPETLGEDRLALIAGAVKSYPKKNVLVIDAGTCVTYDFVNSNAEYLGGAIAPGLQMRLNAMHELTKRLPKLEFSEIEFVTGASTKECMMSGAVNGLIYEINGFISDYYNNFKDLTVILTGGNALFLSKRLKNGIFANSNFLLEGLNFILEYNKLE